MTKTALNAYIIMRNYLMRGHEKADLDPLSRLFFYIYIY